MVPANSPAPDSVVEPPLDQATAEADTHETQASSDSEVSNPAEPVTSDTGPGPSPLPAVSSPGPHYSAAGALAQDQARSLADQQLELASDVTMQTLMQTLHQYELWSGQLPAIDPASDAGSRATSLSRRRKHCRYVYHEIITTEADFVKHLCVVVHDYMAPLARHSQGRGGAPTPTPDTGRSVTGSQERGGGGEDPSVRAQRWSVLGDGGGRASSTALLSQVRLPDGTFQQIFGSIAVLLPVNMELLRRIVHGFEDRGEAGQAEVVAQVFLKLAPFMRLYGEYCRNYYSAVKALQQELGRNKGFRGFAAAVREEVQECDNLDLQSLLIKPVQRICKYPLLLRDLMKHLPEDDPALANMQRALSMVETIARDVNAYIQQQELNSQLLKVCAAFGQWGSDILSPTRRIVAEWPDLRVSGIRSSDYSNPKEYHAFLFNDIMIFGRSKSKAFRRRTASISLTSKAVTSQHSSTEHQRDDDSGAGNVKLKLAGLVYLHELRLPQEWVGAGPTSPRRPATAAGAGDDGTNGGAATAGRDAKGASRRRKVPPPALPNMRPSTAGGSNRVNEAAALTEADFGDGLTVSFMVLRRANPLTGSTGTSDRKLVVSTAAPAAGQTGVEKLTMQYVHARTPASCLTSFDSYNSFGSEAAKRQFVGVLLPTLNADRQLRVNLARRQLREPGTYPALPSHHRADAGAQAGREPGRNKLDCRATCCRRCKPCWCAWMGSLTSSRR